MERGGARVPSGLSEEMEEEQDRKKEEKRKGLREKMKARATTKEKTPVGAKEMPVVAMKDEESERKGPQRIGGGVGESGGSLAGLTPDVRARIERERRARAAEARMATR